MGFRGNDLERIKQIQVALLALLPDGGAAISHRALKQQLQAQGMDCNDEEYHTAKELLIASGVVGRAQGRGGALKRLSPPSQPLILKAEVPHSVQAPLILSASSPSPAPPPKTASKPKKSQIKAPATSTDKAVLSYRHNDKRKNNPEVGMVTPGNDADDHSTEWHYDPHIDPALQFDVGRADLERLIDEALASGDEETMRAALEELKRASQPYLNWTGKAERTRFAVDTVSLHVHERIDPASILAVASKQINAAKKGRALPESWRQPGLFDAPFENLPLRDAIDFYHHDKGWSNRLIAGDSLLVMNSLLQKESMAGKVQMIYIDPPYGIKYGSNFQPFVNKRDVKDRSDEDLTREPETIKAFRDTWELGIHSYLTYLRDRLLLAKELLHESGSVFVQISDENLHNVMELMNEIFNRKNYSGLICFSATTGQTSERLAQITDYIVWYSKDNKKTKFNRIYDLLPSIDNPEERYVCVETDNGSIFDLSLKQKNGFESIPKGRILKLENTTSQSRSEESSRSICFFWFCI